MLGYFINAVGLQAVCWEIDIADAIIPNEQIDDLRQFPPQRRLTAAEPKICEWGRIRREPHNFIPREIAFLIQLVPVKTRLAGRVAMRRHEKNDRVEFSLAAEAPNTCVSLGEISL